MTSQDHLAAIVRPPRKLRVGFLGGAYESAVGRVHRTAIEMDQRFMLAAGCFSRNAATNLASGLQYGLDESQIFRDLSELIAHARDHLDAIVILTPTNQHHDQVEQCLGAGIPVICEKALVSSAAHARALKDTVQREGGFLAVTYNYTGYPMLRELKHLVDAGGLGRLQQIRIEMPQEGFLKVDAEGKPMKPQGWRLQDGFVPTLSLDLGVHLHMMAKFLTKEHPLEVVATGRSHGNFPGITDTVSCLANYSNGLDCSIWYTKTALGQRNGLKVELYGERGAAIWIQESPESMMLYSQHGDKVVFDRASPKAAVANQGRYSRFKAGHPAGFIEAFANYYHDVADALLMHIDQGERYQSPYVFGVDDVLEGIEMLEAMATSALNKQWVSLHHE